MGPVETVRGQRTPGDTGQVAGRRLRDRWKRGWVAPPVGVREEAEGDEAVQEAEVGEVQAGWAKGPRKVRETREVTPRRARMLSGTQRISQRQTAEARR
jgi:hypothetical protein